MRKVFHFDISNDAYVADAAVVWCFDHRFDLPFRKFLERRGLRRIDAIKLAGGAKALASPDSESERTFVLDQIRKSIALHATSHVILMTHSDCGGYGGLAAFGNDPGFEAEQLSRELARAGDYLGTRIPGVRISTFFVNFEGVWDAAAASESEVPA
jgi:hypothetical protein